MRIAVCILAILFGLLHLLAAATQFKSTEAAVRGFAISMACGGICVAFIAIAHLVGRNPNWMDALSVATGSLLICGSAYANGRRAGKLHPAHHAIRGLIAVLLVVGFVLW